MSIFGKVDTSYKSAIGFTQIVKRSNAASLLLIIQSVARPGSIMHSDEWRAFGGHQGMGFAQKMMNRVFVETDGIHTQTVVLLELKKTLIKSLLE